MMQHFQKSVNILVLNKNSWGWTLNNELSCQDFLLKPYFLPSQLCLIWFGGTVCKSALRGLKRRLEDLEQFHVLVKWHWYQSCRFPVMWRPRLTFVHPCAELRSLFLHNLLSFFYSAVVFTCSSSKYGCCSILLH